MQNGAGTRSIYSILRASLMGFPFGQEVIQFLPSCPTPETCRVALAKQPGTIRKKHRVPASFTHEFCWLRRGVRLAVAGRFWTNARKSVRMAYEVPV